MNTALLVLLILLGSILLIAVFVKLMILLRDYSMSDIPPARGHYPTAADTNDKMKKYFKHLFQIIRNFMKRAFYTVIILLSVKSSKAQRAYSLKEAIDTALNNSLQLKADNYDLEKTKASVKQARSSLLPSVSLNGSYQYQANVPVQMIPADVFGGEPGTYQASKFSVPQSKSATLQMSQPLFNASLLIALKAAKVAINLNMLQIRSSKEDLVYNVSATYYNIQTIIKQQELLKDNFANTAALLEVSSEQLKAGLATQTDVDRLTVSRDNTAASLESTVSSLEKQYNLLKLLMNLPLDRPISVVKDDYEQVVVSLDMPNFNPTQKTNYLQIQENKRVADLQRRNIKAGYLPTLSQTMSNGYSGYYSNANPFKNLNNKWYYSSSIGLTLSVPIFDGFSKKNQIRQKEMEIKKYDVQAEQTLQQNNKDAANAYADLKSNYITLQTQRRNLVLAQKVLDDINIQYKSGIAKITDVINSQTELQSAQNNFINAVINLRKAELDLKKAQGSLLQ